MRTSAIVLATLVAVSAASDLLPRHPAIPISALNSIGRRAPQEQSGAKSAAASVATTVPAPKTDEADTKDVKQAPVSSDNKTEDKAEDKKDNNASGNTGSESASPAKPAESAPAATAATNAAAGSKTGDVNNQDAAKKCAAAGLVTCGSSGSSCMPAGATCCVDTTGEMGSYCEAGSYCHMESDKSVCKKNFVAPSSSAAGAKATGAANNTSGAEKTVVVGGMGMLAAVMAIVAGL